MMNRREMLASTATLACGFYCDGDGMVEGFRNIQAQRNAIVNAECIDTFKRWQSQYGNNRRCVLESRVDGKLNVERFSTVAAMIHRAGSLPASAAIACGSVGEILLVADCAIWNDAAVREAE